MKKNVINEDKDIYIYMGNKHKFGSKFQFNSYLRAKQCVNEEYIKRVISKNGLELEFVKNKTYEICKLAMENNIYSFVFIDDELKNKFVKFLLWKSINYVNNNDKEYYLNDYYRESIDKWNKCQAIMCEGAR